MWQRFCNSSTLAGVAKSAGRYRSEFSASFESTTVLQSSIERVSVSQLLKIYSRIGARPRYLVESFLASDCPPKVIVAKNKLPARHAKLRPQPVILFQFRMKEAFPLNSRYPRLE